jgi:hypothetical protein
MRMMLNVSLPNDEFNQAVRDGSAGEKLQRIISEAKPEAVYFIEDSGTRSVVLVVDVEHSWEIPGLAEPWFLIFNATTRFRIAMTPDDLALAGLDELGGKWG